MFLRMTISTTNLWAAGCALALVSGAAIYLVSVWRSAWARRRREQEALYQKFGKEPPLPASPLRFIWGMLSMYPMLLFFSLCSIFWVIWCFVLLFVRIFCAITGRKNPYDRPMPPDFPKTDHSA
jgi:hypothetical protein